MRENFREAGAGSKIAKEQSLRLPEDIAKTRVQIADVQRDLLQLFTSDSILMGHGLDGDLIALKLVHYKVVDIPV